uniref:Mitochondrial substrate carrier family protein ucpb-like n=1 Tax=Tetraselmis sp. GSL018 TaxID=582737 RepID=A0A061RG20_9CHLO|mmetsp:Transcript_5569/g.13571  ORF Transcript_5569/g.13571 Transcript_5569/m.13571 type:complete len:104 (-) Transcript_5569:764-1075(-)
MVESMVEAKQSWSRHYPLCANLLTSGVSVSTASLCTNPLDVLKVRLQLQQRRCARSHGLAAAFREVLLQEGLPGFWRGATPSVARGLVYGGKTRSLNAAAAPL